MFKKPSNPIISLLILFVMLLSGVMQVYAAVIPTVTTQPALTTYYRAINIDYTKVPNTDQTDFPILVQGTYSYLKTVANGGKVQNANGYDIGFYSDSGLTTPLKFEINKWSATTGELIAWIKIPTLSHTTNTTIYMAYGNPSITTDQSDPAGVWTNNYLSVWHLGDGTTLNLADSTSNNNTLVNVNNTAATLGKFYGGADFVRANSNYMYGDTVIHNGTDMTSSVWINVPAGPGAGINETVITLKNGVGTHDKFILWNEAVKYYGGIYNTGGPYTQYTSVPATTAPLNQWVHVVYSTKGGYGYPADSFQKIIVNGTVVGTSPYGSSGGFYSAPNIYIGAILNFSYSRYLTAKISEPRVASVARSEDWVMTEYNNQSNPGTFYSVGNESLTITLNGTITNDGGENATVRGFNYGLTTSYGTDTTENGSFSTGAYTANISSLTCGTTYHFRSYATNSAGTGYGSDDTFTTSPCPVVPTLTTEAATTITKTSAILNGTITNDGGENATVRGFNYGLTTSYGTDTTENGSFSTGAYTANISSLTCGTTYHFRSYATNSAGTGYGSDQIFNTIDCPPYSNQFGILYGSDGGGGNDDNLYIINPFDGSIHSTIGHIGYYVTGLAFHPTTKVLYGATINFNSDSRSLVSIDVDTAEGFLLGKLKDSGDIERGMADIAFRSDGKLYGWTNNNGGSDLYLIDINSCNGDDDTDCLVTKVGEFGQGTYGNGLSFDSNDNLYLFGDGDEDYFWKIDPDTGEYIEEIEFSSSGNGYTIGAASFDSNNTLYGARRNYGSMPADLITVDVNTGTITSKGQSTDMQYIDAIAFLPPEPTSTSTSTGSSTILLSVLQKMSDELKKNTTNTICPQGHNYSIVTGAPCTSFISTPISNQSNFFNRNLRLKDIGQDVLALQKYLNSKGFLVSQTGYGSLNNETTFFGPKTKTALIKFQKANNIFPPFGFFGPITRDFINK